MGLGRGRLTAVTGRGNDVCREQTIGRDSIFRSAAERAETAADHRNSSSRCDATKRARSISGWLSLYGLVIEVGS